MYIDAEHANPTCLGKLLDQFNETDGVVPAQPPAPEDMVLAGLGGPVGLPERRPGRRAEQSVEADGGTGSRIAGFALSSMTMPTLEPKGSTPSSGSPFPADYARALRLAGVEAPVGHRIAVRREATAADADVGLMAGSRRDVREAAPKMSGADRRDRAISRRSASPASRDGVARIKFQRRQAAVRRLGKAPVRRPTPPRAQLAQSTGSPRGLIWPGDPVAPGRPH
jgi:hypothetical protein